MLNYFNTKIEELNYPLYNNLNYKRNELKFILAIVDILKDCKLPIIFIAKGSSMLILSSILIYILRSRNKKASLLILRKEGEISHDFEDYRNLKFQSIDRCCYCVVDDLIFTGDTIVEIINTIKPNNPLDYLFVSHINYEYLRTVNKEIINSNFTNIYCSK